MAKSTTTSKKKSKCEMRETTLKRSSNDTYWTAEQAKGKLIVSLEYPGDDDEELVPLLDLLNSVPGIRTLFSCCGHSTKSFYMVLAFTSLQARSLLENMVATCKHLDKNKLVNFVDEDCCPHARFTIEDFGDSMLDSIVFENHVGFYSSDLGMKKKTERIKDYKRMCKFIMKLVPRKHW